jgi:carbonic anhydrase
VCAAARLTAHPCSQVHPGDASAAAVMYYAIHALGVRHVVVAGHTCCGGAAVCAAAAKAGAGLVDPGAGGASAPINHWLAPLVKLAASLGPDASACPGVPGGRSVLTRVHAAQDEIIVANVKQQVKHAAASEPVQSAWAKGLDVHVHGWLYHLDKGTLEDLNVSVGPKA